MWAAMLLVATSALALASVWRDSPIVDEVPHIGAGYSYIADRTYQLNPEHPPLAKDLAGLALLPLHINPNFLEQYNAAHPDEINDQWSFGRALIFHSGVDPIKIVHAAKLPMLIFFLLSGILIFTWTSKTYNPRAGLLAVFLFTLCPTVIAHSRFVTTDVAALFGVLFATYFFIRFLSKPSAFSFVIGAIAFGIALLTKFSTFLLGPYFLILALVWGWIHYRHFKEKLRPAIQALALMIVGFIIVVGPVYQFHITNYTSARQKHESIELLRSFPGIMANIVIWGSDKPVIRPYAQYGLGLTMVTQRAAGGNQTYFMGQVSSQSFKSYFPIVFLIKETLPFLILLLAALWIGFIRSLRANGSLREKIKNGFPEIAMLLWIAIYGASTISSNLNIGIRHLMPIYGFLFILTAGQIEKLIEAKKWARKALYVLAAWAVLEFAFVYPYYLTYFNELAGGPSGGHSYVVDSNLDWGQDLWRLADYVKENKISKIYVDYFGWADQEFYIGKPFIWSQGGTFKNSSDFFAANPQGGWLAISATYFQQASIKQSDFYHWLKSYKPETVIGNSIFVYHLTR